MTDDACPMAGWEVAIWTLTCLIALLSIAVVVQVKMDDRQWSHVEQPHVAHTVCGRGGCVTTP